MLPVVASADELECVGNHLPKLTGFSKDLKHGSSKSGGTVGDEEMLTVPHIQPFDSF